MKNGFDNSCKLCIYQKFHRNCKQIKTRIYVTSGPFDTNTTTDYKHIANRVIDSRRKAVASTNALKSWLFEHRKNPYPTKAEKIMLAILTKMSLTQVT